MPETRAESQSTAHRWRSALDAGVRAADGRVLHLARLNSGRSGDLMGSGVGQSVEFMDFREYEPGDDIRRIDWQVFARTDRVMIRRHREEISPSIQILLDGSRSMDLPGTPKADTALAVSGALAAASIRTGLSTRFAGVHSASPRTLPLRDPRQIDWPGFTSVTTLAEAAASIRSERSTHGMRIVVSDMLFSCDFTRLLRDLARGVHTLVIVQVLAQADIDPSRIGSVLLRDRETNATVQVNLTETIVARYRERFHAHASMLREAANSARAIFVDVVASDAELDAAAAVRTLIASGILRSIR